MLENNFKQVRKFLVSFQFTYQHNLHTGVEMVGGFGDLTIELTSRDGARPTVEDREVKEIRQQCRSQVIKHKGNVQTVTILNIIELPI